MKEVTVFAPMGTLDHQTGILNAIRCYASAGYDVEVLAVRNRRFPMPCFDSPRVRVRFMPLQFDSDREPRTLVTLMFSAWALVSFWRRRRLIFAGGIRGLLAAYLYSGIRRCEYINYQTELYIGTRLDTWAKRLFKSMERRAARRSRITIEHDLQRRELLAADLGVALERIVVVPNAPCGPARLHRSELLHERLGLEPTLRLLLNAGTMNELFQTSTAVAIAQHLPPQWLCVVHSAQPRSPDEPYLRELAQLNHRDRVRFSLTPLPYDQIDDLMGSATVGLVLYSGDDGQNMASVGLSSGKLSHFLKLGVPVIVSPLPGLADFVRLHGVGEVLEDPHRLPALVERIEADLDGYRTRALRCFEAHLSYESHFDAVLAASDAIVAAAA
jgi:glycosyltransferase involved in cell wall biosynthesis